MHDTQGAEQELRLESLVRAALAGALKSQDGVRCSLGSQQVTSEIEVEHNLKRVVLRVHTNLSTEERTRVIEAGIEVLLTRANFEGAALIQQKLDAEVDRILLRGESSTLAKTTYLSFRWIEPLISLVKFALAGNAPITELRPVDQATFRGAISYPSGCALSWGNEGLLAVSRKVLPPAERLAFRTKQSLLNYLDLNQQKHDQSLAPIPVSLKPKGEQLSLKCWDFLLADLQPFSQSAEDFGLHQSSPLQTEKQSKKKTQKTAGTHDEVEVRSGRYPKSLALLHQMLKRTQNQAANQLKYGISLYFSFSELPPNYLKLSILQEGLRQIRTLPRKERVSTAIHLVVGSSQLGARLQEFLENSPETFARLMKEWLWGKLQGRVVSLVLENEFNDARIKECAIKLLAMVEKMRPHNVEAEGYMGRAYELFREQWVGYDWCRTEVVREVYLNYVIKLILRLARQSNSAVEKRVGRYKVVTRLLVESVRPIFLLDEQTLSEIETVLAYNRGKFSTLERALAANIAMRECVESIRRWVRMLNARDPALEGELRQHAEQAREVLWERRECLIICAKCKHSSQLSSFSSFCTECGTCRCNVKLR